MFYKSTPMYEIKEYAQASLKKALKAKLNYEPIVITGSKIVNSWWGKAWCDSIESYASLANRLPRGKSYVKNGCVIDLKIERGKVFAVVQGSRKKPYDIQIFISELKEEKWQAILKLCAEKIKNVEDLANGVFPKELEFIFKDKKYGLFPNSNEIKYICSCPDGVSLCKHVAAAIYAIGSKLDTDPLLFFKLRGVDSNELIKKSLEDNIDKIIANALMIDDRIIDDELDIFEI